MCIASRTQPGATVVSSQCREAGSANDKDVITRAEDPKQYLIILLLLSFVITVTLCNHFADFLVIYCYQNALGIK